MTDDQLTIDQEPCICEENKICTDEVDFYALEFPNCMKANPVQLCCKYCPAYLDKSCTDPCAGIYKE